MQVKNVLWHSFREFGTDQLRDGKKIVAACAGTLGPEFAKLCLVYRSNSMTIPLDCRMNASKHGRTPVYPQEWHFNWMAWTKGTILSPAGFDPTRFGIALYLPETRELRICTEIRRVGDGPFALRLNNEDREVFALAERQIGLRSPGIFGGSDETAKQLPEKIDLY